MAGRPKKTSVWNYFKYERDHDKSVCQVRISKNEEEVIHGKKLCGMYASNVKKNLKLQH